jgi:hypothetical protein
VLESLTNTSVNKESTPGVLDMVTEEEEKLPFTSNE